MCGIGGIAEVPLKSDMRLRCAAMQKELMHRGPDDCGEFIDERAGISLVHTRLSILDLSPAGHQPMQSRDGRFTIVFNGEIYNFQLLREQLNAKGVRFNSHSDTEVLLQLYATEGRSMLPKLEGMFAFAIWDRDNRSLFMARDPLGIKQLYYWQVGGTIAFASEMRSLLAARLATPQLDRDGIARYLLMGSVQEPDTLVEGIRQLPAGHWLLWSNSEFKIERYWKLEFPGNINSPSQAATNLRHALDDSIQRHFVSDVPIGIFLSGGIDSSAIVAIAKANGYSNLKTFCISFGESEFDEGDIAQRTAKHFGTEHIDWRLTEQSANIFLDDFLRSSDLPSNDGFNTYTVSKLARSHGIKVVLSGLGGDELFGGYPSFQAIPKLMLWHQRARLLGPFRGAAAVLLKYFPGSIRMQADRLACFLQSDGGPFAAYWTMRAFFTPTEACQIVCELTGKPPSIQPHELLQSSLELPPNGLDAVSWLEMSIYMRNQLLRDSDVMSMAHGLELRVPFVDRKLAEATSCINSQIRYRPGKRQLIEAVPEVPSWVIEQPKRGFRIPFEHWVKQHWAPTFDGLQAQTQVELGNWYRLWTFFSLQNFLQNLV